MDPNKRWMNAKDAWLLYQDLSEGESEGGEITVDVSEEESDGAEEESVGGEIDDPSFLPGDESSTEDEEPTSRKRPRLLVTSEGSPSTHTQPSDTVGAHRPTVTGKGI